MRSLVAASLLVLAAASLAACTVDPLPGTGDGGPGGGGSGGGSGGEGGAGGEGGGSGGEGGSGGGAGGSGGGGGGAGGAGGGGGGAGGEGGAGGGSPCPGGDADGDGVCDEIDACPGFDDRADRDLDGVADGCDRCPADPLDDGDGDGVCDSDDVCAGFDDALDTDGDGVPDGCDIVCDGGTVDCDNVCVDTATDAANCGGCGVTCGADEHCDAGACAPNLFWASGVQQNVDPATLVGWTQCFAGTYDQSSPPLADLHAACPGRDLLLACRPVGAATFTLAAMAPREDVTFDCGFDRTCSHNANGVEWYYSDNYSWGFAPGGEAVNRDSCDYDDGSQVAPELRMCWHTGAGSMNGGYRCGANELNSDGTWERLVFQAGPCPDADADGICDATDTCVGGDPLLDADGDGVCDAVDACPGSDDHADADGDRLADGCDACPFDPENDADADGVCGDVDNCGFAPNPGQEDADADFLGDACDVCALDPGNDLDGDGVCGDVDVCPFSFDPGQEDADLDGTGDACDACPLDATGDSDGDGVCDGVDVCPGGDDLADADGDGIPDFCDAPAGPRYWASGVQQNVPAASLTGWTQCFSGTYTGNESLATILANCPGDDLLLGCRPVGSPDLTLAAMAPRADVTFDCGTDRACSHNANGVEWYYDDSWSWGFAPGGDAVDRFSCDYDNGALPDQGLRMCWHTGAGNLSSGYRCGANNLNNDAGWERVIYASTGAYWASGVQQNLDPAVLTGWTQCHSETFSSSTPVANILASCDQANLLMACRPVGAATFTLAAMAPRADVLFDCGNQVNCTQQSNGVGWYYSDGYSWGFAPGGEPVSRQSCDWSGGAPSFPDQRMCIHTNGGSTSSGYRCGNNDLNGNAGWERVFYTAP